MTEEEVTLVIRLLTGAGMRVVSAHHDDDDTLTLRLRRMEINQ